MTGTSIETLAAPRASMADRVGQATAVEQARAVAEVQAAIVVAQQCPRDMQSARAQMLDSCAQMALASRAFFRYSRGGAQVTGPSIHLARELARCFGNIQYGVSELRRDDEHGQSEMQAWAWDVQNNTRSSHTFIVPHRRDTKRGQVPLTELRDIYESNANNGARRVREAIFAVLPPWFVEEAKSACEATLAHGDGVPLPKRIADAVTAFAGIGVLEPRLEARIGRATSAWTAHDVAALGVVYTSIQRGEATIDEEFPADRVTAAEITASAPEPQPTASQAITSTQLTAMGAAFTEIGWTDRDDRLRATSAIVGRQVDSAKALTRDEASTLLDTLTYVREASDPAETLTEIVASAAGVES